MRIVAVASGTFIARPFTLSGVASDSIEQQLAELSHRLNALPEAEEPPPTTLQILNRSHQEKDWQQLFVHFLRPDAPMASTTPWLNISSNLWLIGGILRTHIPGLISTVEIAREVVTEQGRPDVVIAADDVHTQNRLWLAKIGIGEGLEFLSAVVKGHTLHNDC